MYNIRQFTVYRSGQSILLRRAELHRDDNGSQSSVDEEFSKLNQVKLGIVKNVSISSLINKYAETETLFEVQELWDDGDYKRVREPPQDSGAHSSRR